jgi:hypothetical protein
VNGQLRLPSPLPAYEMVACPVHHRLVSFDIAGHLIGRCDACAAEAAVATLRIIRSSL